MDVVRLLQKHIDKSKIKSRLIDRLSYASDAGFYQLVPQAVILPDSEDDIKKLFDFCNIHHIPLTFRTGGTSLSGQAISDGLLIDLSQKWRKIKVNEDGKSITTQPGVIGSTANNQLKKYHTKIGPDPSSIASAMMGGIISNNSSGMCCGVIHNSYHTLRHLTFILPNGKKYNTQNSIDYTRFIAENEALCNGLSQIRQQIIATSSLYEKIRTKYQTKNTVGYSINSFIDYEHPLDIFAHLLVGAEGTLAFISEATLDTIADKPHKATSLIIYNNIYAACSQIPALKDSGAEALELMDRASLKSIEDLKGCPPHIQNMPAEACALLVEYQSHDLQELDILLSKFYAIDMHAHIIGDVVFTKNAEEQAALWKLRKGMFPAVGALRQKGTTVILEDIAFPIEKLADATTALQRLFVKYSYHEAIIFGHAKDGNLHFVITQTFNENDEVQRYASFIDDVVHLVVTQYDGALKAEHGTGRNMAPFVQTEWGNEAYAIMKSIKSLADPNHILNPGVIINDDKYAHLKNLKALPSVEQEVDKCIECGYCEAKCPSKDLTLTPRRRIVVRRELAKMRASNDIKNYNTLLHQYQYDGLETCAVDGLCATDCPVNINTGDLVKRLRHENHSQTENYVAKWVAKNFYLAENILVFTLRILYNVNRLLGGKILHQASLIARKITKKTPIWLKYTTSASAFRTSNPQNIQNTEKTAIYFTTCICRLMGNNIDGKNNIQNTFIETASRAGIDMVIPNDIHGLCCGQAFSSKGYFEAYVHTVNNTIIKLYQYSHMGAIPIVMDLSSCTHSITTCKKYLTTENAILFDKLIIYDSVTYLQKYVMPTLTIAHKKNNVILHPVCSLTKMGTNSHLHEVASMCAHQVIVPAGSGCCGMAGDRGFIFPELTQSATSAIANDTSAQGYYCTSKTCEIALSETTDKNYESIIYLVEEVSR
ncbi:MAG: FAD-binding and (Fe-S)-binding domain-containing protein [Cytophagales bacterium]|nr:FAD-binding and (Fe-S)-binding domain-containing protein [Cytophagales bacterium]